MRAALAIMTGALTSFSAGESASLPVYIAGKMERSCEYYINATSEQRGAFDDAAIAAWVGMNLKTAEFDDQRHLGDLTYESVRARLVLACEEVEWFWAAVMITYDDLPFYDEAFE